jgi:predicted murein hydrolase (TIGR00659 family)
MNEMLLECGFFGTVITLLAYEIGVVAKRKLKVAIVNPLLIAVILVISFLVVFHVDYETYENGAKYISYFLTPATVSLAIPLYRRLELLKKYPKAIFVGIASGVLTAMVSIFLMSLAFGLTHTQYVTLLPKSITTAIGMGVSEELGGIPTITVCVIILTGILGNVIAEGVCRLFGIREPLAKGLAIGTASHAIGTAKAMELGEVEGAMSSLAIAVAGLVTAVAAPLCAGAI